MREVLEMRLTEWRASMSWWQRRGPRPGSSPNASALDVVISDVQLPELSGLALLQLLKTATATGRVIPDHRVRKASTKPSRR